MAILELNGVWRNGPRAPTPEAQPIEWPRGEDGALLLTVVDATGEAADLTGCTLIFALRDTAETEAEEAEDPQISRQADITDAAGGAAEILISAGDTVDLDEAHLYRFDVQLIDADGKRTQVVPESQWLVQPIVAEPDDDVTLPEDAEPLGLGPSWLNYGEGVFATETDGTTDEQLAREFLWDFDSISASCENVFVALTTIARVTGGTGTVRVRHSGTLGEADGTLLVASDAITSTSDIAVFRTATVAKPTGVKLVKVTIQNSTNTEKTTIRGSAIAAHGAV
jgi:hypothetical protein